MKQLYFALTIILATLTLPSNAQQKPFDFSVRAGFAIGGASPIGFPESIRKIDKFNPGLQLNLEAVSAFRLADAWAIDAAIRFEQKGMTTESRVKGYYTTFNAGDRSGDESITGYYTGNVETSVKNSYLTIPIHLVYQFKSPFSLKVGGFVSTLLEKKFTGSATDGYLRHQTPVGEKEEISKAAYDFSGEIRKLNAGVEVGADYRLNHHLGLSLNVSWALTPLMNSDFQSIDFKLYNLFVSPGITYHF